MASRESSSKSRSGKPLHSVDLPVFVISVAAELAGMHPQTLRQYDRIGLVQPSRAPGKARRYSQRDVKRVFAAGTSGDVVHIARGTRPAPRQRSSAVVLYRQRHQPATADDTKPQR